MSLGVIALLTACVAAGWLLLRVARGRTANTSTSVTALKAIIWLGLVAVLLAVKLWPLAFMVLAAAGSVMAIEMWRENAIAADASARPMPPATTAQMTHEEALAVLGLEDQVSLDDIRTAHKRLISQIHPDKGGTDYLAAKINQARDVLLCELGH